MILTTKNDNKQLLHKHLTLLHHGASTKLLKQILVGLPLFKWPKECICIFWINRKMKQTIFKASTTSRISTRPVTLVHIDLCRPMLIYTWDSSQYVMVINDNYTNKCDMENFRSNDQDIKQFKSCVESSEMFFSSNRLRLGVFNVIRVARQLQNSSNRG